MDALCYLGSQVSCLFPRSQKLSQNSMNARHNGVWCAWHFLFQLIYGKDVVIGVEYLFEKPACSLGWLKSRMFSNLIVSTLVKTLYI